jgi:restriction system protein
LAVPDFQSCMLPLLELASNGVEHTLEEARASLAQRFGLDEAEVAELLPSGRQPRFANRVAWAKVYLQQAGLLSSRRRAHFEITARGQQLLAERTDRVDMSILERFEEFREFRSRARRSDDEKDSASTALGGGEETPEEALERAHQGLRAQLAQELLEQVKSSSARFFEMLVVELLLKMGYGRSRADAGKAIGRAGDEGIDGVISEDRLGLDVVYIQAKRWEGTVGRPELQKFVGALHGKRARKGVFITSGTFSTEAVDYVSRIDPRVVLIDGQQLAELMIDLDLGVTVKATYQVKRVDSDFFVEE